MKKLLLAALLVASTASSEQLTGEIVEDLAICYGLYKASGDYFGAVAPSIGETFGGTARGSRMVGAIFLANDAEEKGKKPETMGVYMDRIESMGYGSYQKTMGYFEVWKQGGEKAWSEFMEECKEVNQLQAKIIQGMRRDGIFDGAVPETKP